jgi:AcrR family transcriptional regulator
MSNPSMKRARGRPRSFDKDEAIQIALNLFRQHGFDNTSLEELTTALNVNKPSLYVAFGNKEQLFLEVLNAYISGPTAYFHEVFKETTSKALVRKLLTESIEILFYSDSPYGCLVVMSTASKELHKVGIQQKLVSSLKEHQQRLAEYFEQSKANGDLKQNVDSQRLALYVVTLHKGLSLQAINGSSKAEMLQLVEQVLDLWPSQL